MPNERVGSVQVVVTTRSGARLDRVGVGVVELRRGGFRRMRVKSQPGPGVVNFAVTLPVGRKVLFVSSRGYYDCARSIDVVGGGDRPVVRVVLESKHSPQFREFEQLSATTQAILKRSTSAGTKAAAIRQYLEMPQGEKAAMLNILAKMGAVPVDAPASDTVLDHLDSIFEFRQDRVHARLRQGSKLLTRIDDRAGRENAFFSVVSASLHEGFTHASFKTEERTNKGNLQLSFAKPAAGRQELDADIDIYADVLRHLFGEVFLNHLTNVPTDPFRVYQVLTQDGIQPEYRLLAAGEEIA